MGMAPVQTTERSIHPAAAPHLAGVSRYIAGRTSGVSPRVHLASNESALGASPQAMQAARQALGQGRHYPAEGAPQLRARLAVQHGASAAEILVTNGSTEAIQLLVRAFPGEVVVPEGSFIAYQRAAMIGGQVVRSVPRRGAMADLEALSAAITPQTRLLFLANPDNPTGTDLEGGCLAAWLQTLPAHLVVVLDEAYREYASVPLDGRILRGFHPNVVVLRTFSKAYGLAALRVGYVLAPAAIVDALDRVRDPFNINAAAEPAALAALADVDWLARAVHETTTRRSQLRQALRQRGLEPLPSAANFLCVLGAGSALIHHLLSEGIVVRPLDGWGYPGAMRITIGSESDHIALLEAMDRHQRPFSRHSVQETPCSQP